MMNRICLSALLGLLTLGLFAGNPPGMPEYSQTLRIKFKTPEETRKAELRKPELPTCVTAFVLPYTSCSTRSATMCHI